MKLDKFVFYNKWVSYILIGFLGPLVAGLGQWVESGTWPPLISWICIGAGCVIGGATQNLSFLSSAWQTMQDKLNGNGSAPAVEKPVDAPPPKV